LNRTGSTHSKVPEGGLWNTLYKTRRILSERLNTILRGKEVIDSTLFEDLEGVLFTSDMGAEITEQLIHTLHDKVDRNTLKDPDLVKTILKEEMVSLLEANQETSADNTIPDKPRSIPEVLMFVGVNGVGKTTTIAKMAHYLQAQGYMVMLVAADTFRAAAIEQLQIWGDRLNAEVLKQKRGADPAAVVYDALSAAHVRNIDKVLIDTAGRLHTKSNLMEELRKIQKVARQQVSGAPHRVILILDAATGQNAIAQSQAFTQYLGVTDIILAKLDGTAKGGAIVGISQKLRIPISFIGTGERLEDLEIFSPREFVDAIFS
jgi:fused signal recognition particle receptor